MVEKMPPLWELMGAFGEILSALAGGGKPFRNPVNDAGEDGTSHEEADRGGKNWFPKAIPKVKT